MKVLKVINNNVVSCLDDLGRETVVMGKGLGFQARPGTLISEAAAEKVFRMENQEQVDKLRELVARVSPDLLELCTHMVDYAGKTLGRRLNPNIYLTLTDHIQFAIERCRQDQNLHNALLTEVRVFYPEEFTMGCYALDQIRQHMGLKLPVDEAASIALHLVNAEYDRSMDTTMRAAQALQPMVEILESSISLDENSIRYSELIVHLKFLAMEVFSSENMEENLPMIPRVYVDTIGGAWTAAKNVCDYLSKNSGKLISGSEAAYLAMCIQRASKPGL